jgi:hypothetical protein
MFMFPYFPEASGFAIWRTGEFSLHTQNTKSVTNLIGRESTNLLNYVDALVEHVGLSLRGCRTFLAFADLF